MIEPPVTRDEILRAFGRAFIRPENTRQHHSKPRASALASCARQQAYDMAATIQDGIGVTGSRLSYDADLTSEQGRAFEGLMERTLESIGITVVNSQTSLPPNYEVSGHPDGELDLSNYTSLVGASIQRGLPTRWGVEFKHLGRFGYEKAIKYGLRVGHPQYILQAGLYGDALGWDAVLWIVSSQDASSIRADAAASLRYKTPSARWAELIDWHPKLHMETMEIREVQGLLPVAKARAKWLSNWKSNSGYPSDVAREYDPTLGQFPCTYCPYLTTCLNDGNTGTRAPELPFRMDN